MISYFLPPWVYLCFTADGAVFLDIKRDEYLGLDHDNAQLLQDMMQRDGLTESRPAGLATELTAAGLLDAYPGQRSRPLAATSIEVASRLLMPNPGDAPRVLVRHVCRFIMSCLRVWMSLHLGSLQRAIERQRRRKARTTASADATALARAEELARVFSHLRTFAYTAHDHCLYDSLVMSDFLSRFGIASTCVFGVRTLPFNAHCWVQVGGVLVTETSLEEIATFSPILAV